MSDILEMEDVMKMMHKMHKIMQEYEEQKRHISALEAKNKEQKRHISALEAKNKQLQKKVNYSKMMDELRHDDIDDIQEEDRRLLLLRQQQLVLQDRALKKDKSKEKKSTIEKMYKSLKKNKSYKWPKILDRRRRDNPPWINGEYKQEPPLEFCCQKSISTYKSTMHTAYDEFVNFYGPSYEMTRIEFARIIDPELYNQDTRLFPDNKAGRTYTTCLKRIYIHAVRNNEI